MENCYILTQSTINYRLAINRTANVVKNKFTKSSTMPKLEVATSYIRVNTQGIQQLWDMLRYYYPDIIIQIRDASIHLNHLFKVLYSLSTDSTIHLIL